MGDYFEGTPELKPLERKVLADIWHGRLSMEEKPEVQPVKKRRWSFSKSKDTQTRIKQEGFEGKVAAGLLHSEEAMRSEIGRISKFTGISEAKVAARYAGHMLDLHEKSRPGDITPESVKAMMHLGMMVDSRHWTAITHAVMDDVVEKLRTQHQMILGKTAPDNTPPEARLRMLRENSAKADAVAAAIREFEEKLKAFRSKSRQ
ncbi:MAG: hypothetical protein ABIG96_05665 [Candidatus Micrarchaeota archaeon]